MKRTEEENMVIGKFLLKINILIFIVLFSLSWNAKAFDQYTKPESQFFFLLKSDSIAFDLKVSSEDLKNLSVVKSNLYSIQEVKSFKNYSRVILKRNVCEQLVPQIQLTYNEENEKEKTINIFFFSKLIDIDKLSTIDKIIFDKKKDIVPPLLFMSSLQIGNYVLCINNKSYKKFETWNEFYFMCYILKNGEYEISENNCKNPYFNFIVK
ncbi:hypothetical protein [Mesonia aestuariivivens]|uniref:Uncharacterized protein n=1 Tax=Mesonia aestuariivivens TaxID=2796128 RepID=A0ABS6W4Q0_9FLAO|nr:hypothetical protein [Mesonia aestuariivivens]MBW2962113.1 hypothetical protein [Mesonia aestuariivivens]